MEESSPSLQEWKDLFTAAMEFQETRCWGWMDDSDVFGIQNPENGEIGYCCVLGGLGHFFGLVVYLGTEGLNTHQGIQSGEIPAEDFEATCLQRCLVASFEARKFIEEPDREILRKLNLTFTGPNGWPKFRSHRPGYSPWYLEKPEVTFLTLALQQAREVTLRLTHTKELLKPPAKNRYFVRVPEQKGAVLSWRDDWLKPHQERKTELIVPMVDELRLQRIKKKTHPGNGIWEADFFYVPVVVNEKGRPFYPLTFLWVDHATGLVLQNHLASPENYVSEFQSQIFRLLEQVDPLPQAVLVSREETFKLLDPFASRLGVELRRVKTLSELERAKKSLFDFAFSPKGKARKR